MGDVSHNACVLQLLGGPKLLWKLYIECVCVCTAPLSVKNTDNG